MSVGLYTEAYGFTERPFTLLPDPDFLFWSEAHRRAFAVLEYGMLTRAPLTVVTGEVGTGKTTLIQHLLGSLDDNTWVGLISNAQGGRGELLRWVLNALGVEHDPRSDYVAMFQILQDFMISEYAEGRQVVLVIDEAQNLSIEALEELRMLTNINSNKDELLQLILVGQPELRKVIMLPELRQFAQRVSATYHIEPFDLKGTRAYIRHRLLHVGGSGKEFTTKAVSAVHDYSSGIPRLINKICDLALVYGVSSQRKTVSDKLIHEIIDDGLILPTRPLPFVLTKPIDPTKEAAE